MRAEPWDDDDRIGIPVLGKVDDATSKSTAKPGNPPEEHTEVWLRAGDTELGRPAQVSSSVSPLTDDDRRRLREAEEAQALRDLAEAEEMLASDPAMFRWAGWFAHPLAAAFLVGSTGVLGLFLYSQLLTILANLAVQPTSIQYAGYSVLGLLTAAVLYSMARLILLYARLRQNRQLRLRGLEELQSRTRLRWLATAKAREAREWLEAYLRDYPMNTVKECAALERVGLSRAVVPALTQSRDHLLDPDRLTSSGEWFERFQCDFQARLDEAADARIRYWSNRAMIVTAVSPNGLVDSLSTAYFGFAMVADLCRVYHLKAGRTGTAVLLGRVFFHAYLAGQINDLEKLVEEQYDHAFEQGLSVVGVGVGSNVASKFLGKVGAKATSGYLNRLLLMRLGRYTCRLLRPVAV